MITLKQAAEQYMAEKVRLRRVAATTAAVQGRMLAQAVAKLGPERPVGDFTRGDARAFLTQLVEAGHRPSYTNTVIVLVGALFGWVERELEARQGNPFARLRAPDDERANERRRPFTDADLTRIWPAVRAQVDPGRRFVPELMLRLGLRPEEAAQLHRRDVERDGGVPTVLIRDGAGQSLKNKASRRNLPLLEGLAPFWRWAEVQPNGFLFGERPLSAERGRCVRISGWFSDELRRAGIEDRKKVLYSLRHTVGTRLAEAGVVHERIGDVLGHERRTMAGQVYISTPPASTHVETLRKLVLPEEIA